MGTETDYLRTFAAWINVPEPFADYADIGFDAAKARLRKVLRAAGWPDREIDDLTFEAQISRDHSDVYVRRWVALLLECRALELLTPNPFPAFDAFPRIMHAGRRLRRPWRKTPP